MENNVFKAVLLFFICLAIYGIINSVRLSKKKKVFTLARIYNTSAAGKRGSTYYFKYFINNKEYFGRADGLYKFNTNSNGLIYIDVLKDDFKEYHVIEFDRVPECMTMADVPKEGWSKIPNNIACP